MLSRNYRQLNIASMLIATIPRALAGDCGRYTRNLIPAIQGGTVDQANTQDDLLRAPTAEELARIHSWTQVSLQRIVDAVLQPFAFLAAVVWLFGGSYTDVAVIAVAASMSYAL